MSAQEILFLPPRAIDLVRGARGVGHTAALYPAVGRPFASFGRQMLVGTLSEKIAAFVHSIVPFHPFADGKKRAALVAADFTRRLKAQCLLPAADVDGFFWSIARGEEAVEQHAQWPAGHYEPCGPTLKAGIP